MQVIMRVIASGSSGNALFLRAGETRLLVDAGIAYRRISRALAEIGEQADRLTAVLLTHEHSDHVRGLEGLLARRPELPVLATGGTLRQVAKALDLPGGKALVAARRHRLGSFDVRPFPVPHDAAEPVGYRIEIGDLALGVATDLGTVTPVVERSLEGCQVLLVEANHDLDMLARGPYPPFLKRRVASRKGHLSNAQAGALLRRLASPALKAVVLAHLSRTNNAPDTALRTVAPDLEGSHNVRLMVGNPSRPLDPIELEVEPKSATGPLGDAGPAAAKQLGLFD